VFPDLLYASILTEAAEVLGVWVASMTIHSGAAASWALLTGQPGDAIARQAAFGLAAGFLVGIPLTVCAALALVLSS
jgi:hypothetical protein